ncbi:MAG: FecR family protein [Verrucomicrobiota bacterium]
MNQSRDSQFEDLLGRFLEENLSSEETDLFVSLLKQDSNRVAQLRDQLLTSELLSRTFDTSRSVSAFAESLKLRLEHSDADANEFVESIIEKLPEPKVVTFPWVRSIGIAAAACMAVFFSAYFMTLAPSGEQVATIAFASDSAATYKTTGETPIQTGQKVEFDDGLIRLDFANGAIVTIEGPASFVVQTGDHIDLAEGTLNAWCPETAHGFKVTTPDAEIVDLGTTFGIATSQGGSEVAVFEGEVTLGQNDALSPRHLFKGEAARSTIDSGLTNIDFDGSPFEKTWPVTSGILDTEGSIHPSPPNVQSQLYDYESDENLIIFPEKRNLQLTEKVPFEFRGPGDHAIQEKQPIKTFKPKASKRFRSYLLHYNPVGKEMDSPLRNFQGSVTFDNRIIAIIADSASLRATDEIFQSEDIRFDRSRGLETMHGQGDVIDSINISEDRKTLDIDFYANSAVDQIRVIVAEAREKEGE